MFDLACMILSFGLSIVQSLFPEESVKALKLVWCSKTVAELKLKLPNTLAILQNVEIMYNPMKSVALQRYGQSGSIRHPAISPADKIISYFWQSVFLLKLQQPSHIQRRSPQLNTSAGNWSPVASVACWIHSRKQNYTNQQINPVKSMRLYRSVRKKGAVMGKILFKSIFKIENKIVQKSILKITK